MRRGHGDGRGGARVPRPGRPDPRPDAPRRHGRRVRAHRPRDRRRRADRACTATTTPTASAPRRSPCWCCVSSAPTSTGTCRAASTRATASPPRPSSGWPATASKLLVTVDCGITAADQVARAAALGMDVIVTDHHRPADVLPACPLVCTPAVRRIRSRSCPAPASSSSSPRRSSPQAGRDPAALELHLDLVALATVADVVPLRRREPRRSSGPACAGSPAPRAPACARSWRPPASTGPGSARPTSASGSRRASTPPAACATPARRSSCS